VIRLENVPLTRSSIII